jgi:hypothetical protein
VAAWSGAESRRAVRATRDVVDGSILLTTDYTEGTDGRVDGFFNHEWTRIYTNGMLEFGTTKGRGRVGFHFI